MERGVFMQDCFLCGSSLSINKEVNHNTKADHYGGCYLYCSNCRIGITNDANVQSKTYIYEDFQKNIYNPLTGTRLKNILNSSLNLETRKAKVSMLPYEKSEEAVIWSFFSWLEDYGLINEFLFASMGIVAWESNPEIYYWGYNDKYNHSSLITLFKRLAADRFNENEGTLTEPDIIIYVPNRGLCFVKAQFVVGNRLVTSIDDISKYSLECPYINNKNIHHFDLLKNWAIGNVIGDELDVPFSLLNIVREGQEINIENEFGLKLDQTINRFKRLTWEHIFDIFISRVGTPPIKYYINTRTINLEDAFIRLY